MNEFFNAIVCWRGGVCVKVNWVLCYKYSTFPLLSPVVVIIIFLYLSCRLQLEDSGGENTYHIEYTTEPAHQVTTSSQRRQSNMSGSNTTKGGGADGGGGGGGGGSGDGGSSPSSKPVLDTEKRMRREIANSNERRRMQSINAGFQSLRSLLPRHEGEKLSKVSSQFELHWSH